MERRKKAFPGERGRQVITGMKICETLRKSKKKKENGLRAIMGFADTNQKESFSSWPLGIALLLTYSC